jgi:hypothetical protein
MSGYRYVTDPQQQQAYIREATSAGEAVRRAAMFAGVTLVADFQADAIAKAAQSWAAGKMQVRQMAPRERWKEEGFREYLRQRMRRELLESITSEGHVPVSLPAERLRFLADIHFSADDSGREVPEAGPWEMVAVILEVGVRTPSVDRRAAVRAGVIGGSAT